MFGYPSLDAGLSISWFLEAMASPKATRHQGLNNRNSGRETIVITIVIVVVRTIQKTPNTCVPIVLAIVLPAQFLLFKIQYPCDPCDCDFEKKYPDLVDPSDKNIAWIKPKWFSKHTSIANLNIDTSFVEFAALRVKILIFKGQICVHLQTRALVLWPKQILKALWIKSTKSEDGTTDVFYKIQFMWDLSSRELRYQLHSSQYRRFILHILFTGESTPLSINTLLISSNHSLRRIFY